MQQSTVKHLLAAAESLKIEADPYNNYSGRGVRQNTTGVVVARTTDFAIIAAKAVYLAFKDDDELTAAEIVEDLRALCSDKMMEGVILY